MTTFLQLTLLLAIILFIAKTAGFISLKLGQPSVLGELLAGILLGPSVINILHLPFLESLTLGETIQELGELGVLLLMFIAGLEVHLEDLSRSTRVSAFAGILGVILPITTGWGVALLFGYNHEAAIFLGLTLGATSVSISAQTLMEMKVLRSRVGMGLLGAAIFDDILIIILLSGFVAITSGNGNLTDLLLILGRMVGFLAVSMVFGLWVLPRLARLVARLPISQGVLSLALVVLLIYGLAAEVLGGMAAITGSFLAGLMFARSHEKERIESGISALAYGLLVPIFFISIGLSINIRALSLNDFWFTFAIILAAASTKLLGSALGARLAGFPWRESWQLGTGMMSRGEVGLIVASVGISTGLINDSGFSAIIGMVVFTTIITPPLLRILFSSSKTGRRNKEKSPGQEKESA